METQTTFLESAESKLNRQPRGDRASGGRGRSWDMRPGCLAVPFISYLKMHTEPYRSNIEKLEADIRCYTSESFGPCELRNYIYGPAVYFLCLERGVVYIGQTKFLPQRIEEHMGIRKGKRKSGDGFVGNLDATYKTVGKAFDATFFVPVVERVSRLYVEAALIREVQPPLNQVQPKIPVGPASYNASMIVKAIKGANQTSLEEHAK